MEQQDCVGNRIVEWSNPQDGVEQSCVGDRIDGKATPSAPWREESEVGIPTSVGARSHLAAIGKKKRAVVLPAGGLTFFSSKKFRPRVARARQADVLAVLHFMVQVMIPIA